MTKIGKEEVGEKIKQPKGKLWVKPGYYSYWGVIGSPLDRGRTNLLLYEDGVYKNNDGRLVN